MAKLDAASAAAAAEADQAIAELGRLRRALDDEIARRLRLLPTDGDGHLMEQQALGNLSAVRSQVLAALEDLGSRPTITVAERRAAAAVRGAWQAMRLSADFPPELLPDVNGLATAAVRERARQVADAFGIARDRIVDAIHLGTTSSAPLEPLIAAVVAEADIAFSRAAAAVETAIISAGRAVAFAAAERANAGVGEEVLVLRYVGPLDRKNRPFCRKLVGKCATVAAIKRMDNGQGLPVDKCGGGYRCRHGWAPIPLSDARARGLTIIT